MPEKKETFLSRDYAMVWLSALATRLALMARSTITPLFVLSLMYTKSQAGLATSCYSFAALFFRPFVGKALDRFGRRNVTVIGLIFMVISLAAMGAAKNLAAVYGLSILCGISFSFTSVSMSTIVTDLTPESCLTDGLGYFGLTNTLGQALGPAIALAIIAASSYSFSFYAIAGIGAIGIVCAMLLSYEHKNKEYMEKQAAAKKETAAEKGSLWKDIVEPTAAQASILVCVFVFSTTAINTFMAAFGEERSILGIGTFFTVSAIGMSISRVFVGKLTTMVKEKTLISVALAVLGASLIAISFCHSIVPLLIIAFIYSLVYGLYSVLTNVMAVRHSAAHRRGAANATYYLFMDVGVGFGAAFWGVVSDFAGIGGAFIGAGILAIILLLVVQTGIFKFDN